MQAANFGELRSENSVMAKFAEKEFYEVRARRVRVGSWRCGKGCTAKLEQGARRRAMRMTAQREGGEQWRGSPLDMELGMDPYGIKEIVFEFDTGEEEIMRPKVREEFGSYELHEAANYLRAGIKRGIRVSGG